MAHQHGHLGFVEHARDNWCRHGTPKGPQPCEDENDCVYSWYVCFIAYLLLGTHTRGLCVAQSLRHRLARRAFGVFRRARRLVRRAQLGLLRIQVCDDLATMRDRVNTEKGNTRHQACGVRQVRENECKSKQWSWIVDGSMNRLKY